MLCCQSGLKPAPVDWQHQIAVLPFGAGTPGSRIFQIRHFSANQFKNQREWHYGSVPSKIFDLESQSPVRLQRQSAALLLGPEPTSREPAAPNCCFATRCRNPRESDFPNPTFSKPGRELFDYIIYTSSKLNSFLTQY
jgi:hypothetical protein